ncbi:ketopantoate reductase family protein [Streptosporangium sandarakinum]|uniref:2-dehydropantoate 2-reductase/glutamate carboxypeptidase n=1 Tax=Streptosporangium sandarakinum TaxID=1260955 RepID=A0A852UXS5_9ACTN|nr:2-dehydropantoate 2-reductase [Streptosporangium sandarakinum]NYF40278.1 2-dehydropantoate 2-reductase/glutamate carboxypeptidase [Streptosporangium sandarakinum]
MTDRNTDTTDTADTTGATGVAPGAPYTIVGGGAIGGSVAFHLARGGHDVLLVDADPAHVAAVRRDGLVLRRATGDETARVRAATPEEVDGPLRHVLLCVKAQATDGAAGWIAPRLAPDGFVVSVQNGLNERLIAEHVGADRVVGAFVNLFADVVEPGVIRDGGPGAFVVGELSGESGPRVDRIVSDLAGLGAKATGNINGYLWSKLGFGIMLTATALADAPMADLIDRHRPLMHALVAEVFAVAARLGHRLEPFDAFDPAAYLPGAPENVREAATDRLTAWLRTQPKDRSGIWRDIAVRHRPVEVRDHYGAVFAEADAAGVATPLARGVLARLTDVETGRAPMSEDHLRDLEAAR